MMLKLKQVQRYRTPGYPNKAEVNQNPAILRIIPKRWRKNSLVLTALGMTISLASCFRGEAGVAPVFEHGQGRGGFGCDSVVAPYFFSEEEALQVICEEAKEYGNLTLSIESPPKFDKVVLKSQDPTDAASPKPGKLEAPKTIEISMDAYSENKAVAIEFVSQADLKSWGCYQGGGLWESYDFLSTAQSVRNGIEELDPDVNIGVFYDPYGFDDIIARQRVVFENYKESDDNNSSAMYEDLERAAKELLEENLRAQVRDFIDWLKAQGVI